VLFDDMACPPDTMIDVTRPLQPRIEAEIAFVLKEDLNGPTNEHVARARPSTEVQARHDPSW